MTGSHAGVGSGLLAGLALVAAATVASATAGVGRPEHDAPRRGSRPAGEPTHHAAPTTLPAAAPPTALAPGRDADDTGSGTPTTPAAGYVRLVDDDSGC